MQNSFVKDFIIVLLGGTILLIILALIPFKTTHLSTLQGLLPSPTPIGWFNVNPKTPVNSIFTPLQKTSINVTTDSEVKKLPDIISTNQTDANTVKYEVKSVNPLTPNEIITQYGKVVFERTSTYTSAPGGLPKISTFTSQFGAPEEVVSGNVNYDEYVNSFLYFSRGIAVIGRPGTDEVYEILRFPPMSRDRFYQLYARYVSPMDPHQH